MAKNGIVLRKSSIRVHTQAVNHTVDSESGWRVDDDVNQELKVENIR